jgi:hypothetical protein
MVIPQGNKFARLNQPYPTIAGDGLNIRSFRWSSVVAEKGFQLGKDNFIGKIVYYFEIRRTGGHNWSVKQLSSKIIYHQN